jgi:hypothetical protein
MSHVTHVRELVTGFSTKLPDKGHFLLVDIDINTGYCRQHQIKACGNRSRDLVLNSLNLRFWCCWLFATMTWHWLPLANPSKRSQQILDVFDSLGNIITTGDWFSWAWGLFLATWCSLVIWRVLMWFLALLWTLVMHIISLLCSGKCWHWLLLQFCLLTYSNRHIYSITNAMTCNGEAVPSTWRNCLFFVDL